MYDYLYIYLDSAGVVRTRWGSLRLASIIYRAAVVRTRRGSLRLAPMKTGDALQKQLNSEKGDYSQAETSR